MNEKENRDNNLPSIPDVIQHPYLEHLQWGMMSCIRERIKRNGTTEEGGPISSHSLTRGIKRYHVLDASNRTHVTLPCYMHSATMFRTCSYRTCFETIHAIPSQLFVRLIFFFDYYSSIGGRSSLLGSNDTTIFIFFLLFLVMVRPLLCRTVAKKSRVSQNVSTIRFVVCVYPRETLNKRLFLFLSLSRKTLKPYRTCYYLVVSINVSSSKRNETTNRTPPTFQVFELVYRRPILNYVKIKT